MTLDFVCDNTDLTAIWGAEAPDVLVVGGFALEQASVAKVIEEVRAVKTKHLGEADAPVKWNIRDLDRALELQRLTGLKPKLLETSEPLRSELLAALCRSGATLFLSILLAYSNSKQTLGKTREDLVGYSFGNLLMRVGLFQRSLAAEVQTQVIVDWPEKNNRHPFVTEYLTGWRHGRSGEAAPGVPYQCGALRDLGFRASPQFAVTDLDVRLQLADLVVGAGRVFVNYAMGKAGETDFGVQRFLSCGPHLYRENGRVAGRGVTVSPAKSSFSKMVFEALWRHDL